LLLAARRGRVLDIACGTGKVMSILAKFSQIELEGCDIVRFLSHQLKGYFAAVTLFDFEVSVAKSARDKTRNLLTVFNDEGPHLESSLWRV